MPKGDAELLKADIDDGYAKISLLLLEMLSCAPLTKAEFRIVLFIMRRTYGWAKPTKRSSGRYDNMNATEIAEATGIPISTAEKNLGNLVRNHVVEQIKQHDRPASPCFYGINTNLSQWGPGYEWGEMRTNQRSAYQLNLYSCRNQQPDSCRNSQVDSCQNPQLPVAGSGNYQLPESATTNCRNPQLQQGINPTGSGAEERLQPLLQPLLQKGGQTATAPPALSEQETTNTKRPTALPATSSALTSIFPDWKPARYTAWLQEAAASVASVAGQQVGLTDELLAHELQTLPPVESSKGGWYCDKLIERLQRNGSGGPPITDPVVREFVAAEGPCPTDDDGGLQIWNVKLERFRRERESS